MKKIILFSAVACSIAFYACKKDSTTTTTDNTIPPAIDPVALSAAVNVGYGASIKGSFPAASLTADAPVLMSDGYNNRTYYAVNNRYVVLFPHLITGNVAGYYVKINGADNYFKIDYATAYGVRKSARKKNDHGNQKDAVDNADSSIIIKLPAGLKGDTFSIKYAAYDSLNKVSNSVTAIVSIITSSDSTDDALLKGSWRRNRTKSNYNDWNDTIAYVKDSSVYPYYACGDGYITYCDGVNNCMSLVSQYYGMAEDDMTFSANNAYAYSYISTYRQLDMNGSNCSNLVYTNYDNISQNIGGYSYNAATKILTIINDGGGVRDGNSDNVSNMYTTQYTVTEMSSTRIVLYSKIVETGEGLYVSGQFTEYKKK